MAEFGISVGEGRINILKSKQTSFEMTLAHSDCCNLSGKHWYKTEIQCFLNYGERYGGLHV